ncbi:MAG: SRPBCC family protein [Gammaproteobacteria bacterium]
MLALDFSKSRPVIGSASIEIDRPVQEVFAFVGENFFQNYPEWAPEVVEFKPINDNPMAVGALARQTRIDQGQKVESTFEITALDPNERLKLNGLSDPYRNSYRFEQINDQKTRLTFSFELLEIELFMRPFEKLIRTAIEEGAQNSLENIKKLLDHTHTEKLSA